MSADANQKGPAAHGPVQMDCLRGSAGHGLNLAGTHTLSGAAGLTTTAKLIAFNSTHFPTDGSGKIPRFIQIRGLSGTCAIDMGRGGKITMAADTFSPRLAVTDLWLGREQWTLTGSGSISFEYIIDYT